MINSNTRIDNYYALLACILNPKLSADKSIKIIVENKASTQKKVFKKMEVTNILTGEVIKYTNSKEAGRAIGITGNYISTYAINKSIYKNMYKFKYVD